MLTNCASNNNHSISTKPDIFDNPQISAFINNKKSMTASLKKLNNHFSVSVLYNGVENEQYTLRQIQYPTRSNASELTNGEQGVLRQNRNLNLKEYKRIVAISLESTPVIVAISSTSLKDKTFYNILSNSKEHSIGLQLFAANSKVKRDPNMHITRIKVSDIKSSILHNYLLSLNYDENQKIIMRTSVFRNQNESMQLTEYVLPSISKFLSSNK